MKKKFIIVILIIAAIVAAVIFFLPMIQEMLAYNKVNNEQTVEACDSYEKDWPEGKHIEDVLYMRVQIAKDDGTCINEIYKYLEKYPDGKYVKEVNNRWDEIWDKEIKKYEATEKSLASADGLDMMQEMLQYMKRERINTLLVTCNPTLDIKDFDEYNEDTQLLMQRTNETSLPYKEGIVSVKSNYDTSSLEALNNLVVSELQQHLNQVFSTDFIKVVSADKTKGEMNAKMPTATFDYKVNNIEMAIGDKPYPQIWSYPATEDDEENPDGFLLGLYVDINISFSIPGSPKTYSDMCSSEISDYLEQVKNLNDGYKEMTTFLLQDQMAKIAKKIGLTL